MQNNAESKVWEVMPPSIENQNPAPEAQQDIDAYLTEHPVRLGAIAERHGIKELVSALPCGISGQSGNELGGIAIRIKLHEASHRQRFTLAHE